MKTCYLFILSFIFSLNLAAQRNIQTINSAWEFSLEKDDQSEIVNIPHTWNAEDAFRDGKEYFRGKGTYDKKLFAPKFWENKRQFLKFEGSNQITTLFVNGEKIGEHRGGYTGFVFDISEALKIGEENEIRIEVDNSHHTDIPPLDADFNFYGGIYRDLELIVTGEVHFELENEAAGNFLVKTPEVSEEKAAIQIELPLVNQSETEKTINAQVVIFNPKSREIEQLEKTLTLKPGEKEKLVFTDEISNPQLWSPETPHLYKVQAKISEENSEKIIDITDSKFGLRWFEVDTKNGFLLNGEPLKLIGANRHQDFKALGNALPNKLHKSDYKTIKEMGANIIRTAHYPQDPEVYKICDELGLLVWSEIPVINDVTDSDAYHNVSLKMQREQILQLYNHPSVVLWGYMNEIFISMVFNNEMTETEKEEKIKTSVELAEKLEKQTKELDKQRLSVMALHENEIYNESGIADIPDVIGWNLYFGWYSPGLESFGEFLDEQHKKYPDRPLFISEYGPGADSRIQTSNPKPWDYSEAYQLKLHRSYINQIKERDFVFGMTAWNFADFGSSFRQDSRPYINQKGLVNLDRTKKDIYYYYQARLLEDPFIYIAGENYEKRYPVDENDSLKINVFSNSKEVKLNTGNSEYTANVSDGIAEFKISLPEGKNLITATDDTVSHSRNIKVQYRKNLLSEIKENDILINVGSHVNFTDETTGEVWISDQEYSPGNFGYLGGEVFQANSSKFQGTASDIKGTKNDPLYQTMREDIESYRFDVEKGKYRVTLYLAEPNFNASEENIYNLSEEEQDKVENRRAFDILINGEIMNKAINPARDYGRLQAVKISYTLSTENAIDISFDSVQGKSILSAIKLEKL